MSVKIVTPREPIAHFCFEQLSAMEPFAEKPIYNLASVSFSSYRVRGK